MYYNLTTDNKKKDDIKIYIKNYLKIGTWILF